MTPASAAVPGVAVQFTELPDRFAAGEEPVTITVEASKRTGGDCLKVRWSMLMQVSGMRLDQVRVDRIEDDQSFPLQVRTDGDVARLTDAQFDPGTLCRDRTVTARYQLAFSGDVSGGEVTLQPEAFDARLQLLERSVATRQVVGGGAGQVPGEGDGDAQIEPTDPVDGQAAGDEAIPEPAAGASQQAIADGDAGGTTSIDATRRTSGQASLPMIGFLSGGVMLFLGFGLLVNVRRKLRRAPVKIDDSDSGSTWSSATRRRRV